MKTLINENINQVNTKDYLNLLMIIVPFLNFLPGFTFDLYTPSMPALAHYYSASIVTIKNTVTATLIGFVVGGFLNGILFDIFGKRLMILLSLFLYIIVSISAIYCHSIEQFIIIRFLQGAFASTIGIGCRAITIDNFKGHQFNVAMLYASLAYGTGPIIGPFIGGILQHSIGWKANFIAYGIIGILLLIAVYLFVNENNSQKNSFSLNRLVTSYKALLTHSIFLSAIFLVGTCQIQIMLYSAVGAFIVENILHQSALVYGNTALIVASSYLVGTLTNRLLIKKYRPHSLSRLGLSFLIISSLVQVLLATFGNLTLFNLIFPTMLICFSVGLILPNVLLISFKLFPQYANIATSLTVCCGIFISAISMFLISHINVSSLMSLALIFAAIMIIQLIIFYTLFKRTNEIQQNKYEGVI